MIQINDIAQSYIDKIKKDCEQTKPFVAISCITYNHVGFIREALDGFLMQQTDFPVVAIVHDDASTDGTADVIREYAEKYPDFIKPIFEKENQYSAPGGPLTKIMYDACAATGAKYIAKCEGDDYWTDPKKLQKQVDFLESHPEYVICTHAYSELNQNTGKIYNALNCPSQDYTLMSYIHSKAWIYLTLTTMFRFSAYKLNEILRYSIRIDAVWIYYMLKQGKGKYLEENMGIYRRHIGGVATAIAYSKNSIYIFFKNDLRVRKCIHRVENSKESAIFIVNSILNYRFGRLFPLKHPLHFIKCISLSVGKLGLSEISKYIICYYLKKLPKKYYGEINN